MQTEIKIPFLISNDYKTKERIIRKGSILRSFIKPLIRQKSNEKPKYIKPLKIQKRITISRDYLNSRNNLDMFLDDKEIDQLNILKNYSYYNSVIRKEFLVKTMIDKKVHT